MKLASRGRNGVAETLAYRLFRVRKAVHLYFAHDPGCAKRIAFIVGCQRSGTSLLDHIFRLDLDCISYRERSVLSDRDTVLGGFRLNPLGDVRARLERDRAPLVVCKPLVESQRTGELLDAVPGSRAIWAYRHYRDVAVSNVQFFADPANARQDLEPIAAGDAADWRGEGASQEVRAAVRRHLAPDLDPHAAAALFWWARNTLFFERGLDREPRLTLCRYEDLVTEPAATVRRLYAFLERPYPGDRVVRDVFASSRGRGREAALPPAVEELCEGLQARLEAAHAAMVVPAG